MPTGKGACSKPVGKKCTALLKIFADEKKIPEWQWGRSAGASSLEIDLPPPRAIAHCKSKWLFVFNSDFLRENQDHRSERRVRYGFKHPQRESLPVTSPRM
jgi:hypothetical protein